MPELDPLDLLGSWTLTRDIVEHPSQERSTVEGATDLVLGHDGRIRWSESGTLSRQGMQIPVSRVLFIEQREAGWFVTFDDGRDFHPWRSDQPVEHLCAADLYTGTIEQASADQWTVRWQVRGPHKDYTMTSVLTRR